MNENISLTKNCIIEGYAIRKNAILTLEEEDNKYNNMMLGAGGESINEDEFIKMCEPLISKLDISPDNAIQIKQDVLNFCKSEWVKYNTLPSEDKLRNYLIGRNQAFSVN